MNIERFYLACLSHASYVVSSGDEAAVIDPQRDVEIYLEYAERKGLKLRYIIETHLHADFVSGHVELAKRSGAEIVMGVRARAEFPHKSVSEGDEISVGSVLLRVLETPGHTPEGICIMARDVDAGEEPDALFSGDTLFAGDVGRPDLLGEVGFSKEQLAEKLYDSLHSKILMLPDETRVYPAHGAGSSCGKALRSVEFSTIGAERLTNYALQPMTREQFIRVVTEGQPEAPAYFLKDALMNRTGAPELDSLRENIRALGPGDLVSLKESGAVILDTRSPDEFAEGFIPGSINIGLDGQFATWVGTLIPIGQTLVLVAPVGREEEAIVRCARVGYENIAGILEGGFKAWLKSGRAIDTFGRLQPDELSSLLAKEEVPFVIDVRNNSEREAKHIRGTQFITLSQLDSRVQLLPNNGQAIIVHCAGGYRSSMAVSILKEHGFADVRDLRGGLGAWEAQGLPVELGANEGTH